MSWCQAIQAGWHQGEGGLEPLASSQRLAMQGELARDLSSRSFQRLALLPPGPWRPSPASPALHTCPRALLNPVGADPLPTPTCWTGRLDSWALCSFLPPPSCQTLAKLLNLFWSLTSSSALPTSQGYCWGSVKWTNVTMLWRGQSCLPCLRC